MTFDRDTFTSELERVVADRLEEAGAGRHAPGVRTLIMRYLHRNAGLVRPRVVYAAAHAYAGDTSYDEEPGDSLRRLALATEILHVFALLHDDRIDNETGGKSSRETAERLLAGDLLFATGFGMLSETVISAGLPGRIVDIVQRTAEATVVGQAADIAFANGTPGIESLFELYDMKTGRYTFVAPLQIGALWAGCPAEDIDHLYDVGIPLGRAFQLRDDLTDLERLVYPAGGGGAGGAPPAKEHVVSENDERSRHPDAAVRSSASVPPWEWNLASAWARSYASSMKLSRADSLPADLTATAAMHYNEIAGYVTDTIPDLLQQAERAATALTLPPPQRHQFIADLRVIFGDVPDNSHDRHKETARTEADGTLHRIPGIWLFRQIRVRYSDGKTRTERTDPPTG